MITHFCPACLMAMGQGGPWEHEEINTRHKRICPANTQDLGVAYYRRRFDEITAGLSL